MWLLIIVFVVKIHAHNTTDSTCDEYDIKRQPAIFVNHGGGPMPYLDYTKNSDTFSEYPGTQQFIIDSSLEIGKIIELNKPKAILLFSAVNYVYIFYSMKYIMGQNKYSIGKKKIRH